MRGTGQGDGSLGVMLGWSGDVVKRTVPLVWIGLEMLSREPSP